jgi:Flp pilus assembly protein TadB
MQSPDSEIQTYAWNWFALHAGQRMQMVNFWLVSIAFLVAAFVQAYLNKLFVVALGVALTGFVASVAFMRLDVRTRQLVQVGEAALRHLEVKRAAEAHDEVVDLVLAAGTSRSSRFDSYRYIIHGLQLTVAGGFLLAAGYSLVSG